LRIGQDVVWFVSLTSQIRKSKGSRFRVAPTYANADPDSSSLGIDVRVSCWSLPIVPCQGDLTLLPRCPQRGNNSPRTEGPRRQPVRVVAAAPITKNRSGPHIVSIRRRRDRTAGVQTNSILACAQALCPGHRYGQRRIERRTAAGGIKSKTNSCPFWALNR